MKMYADYIKERLGDEIVVLEEGFATYRFLNHEGKDSVYIVDIYVRPDFRRTDIASDIADLIVKEGLRRGCKQLIGTVSPSAKHANDSLKVLLGYGLEISSCTNDTIIFKKEL